MEIQNVVEQELPAISAQERRRFPRTLSEVRATLRTAAGYSFYTVRNLSVCGALLTDGPSLAIDAVVDVDLQIPDHPRIRVLARVARKGIHDGGEQYIGLEFLHQSDRTEDLIQAALLDEIERSQTHGIIPQLD